MQISVDKENVIFIWMLYILHWVYRYFHIRLHPVTVILLKRDPVRVENVRALKILLPHMNILNAIDYKSLDTKDYQDYINKGILRRDYEMDIVFNKPMRGGQIAVALSHMTIWENISKMVNPVPQVILEDDAYITRDYHTVLNGALAELPSDWHILYLFVHKAFDSQMTKPEFDIGKKYIIRAPSMFSLVGYVVNHVGVQLLLNDCRPLNTAIDEHTKAMIKNKKLNAYCVKSNIVGTYGDLTQTELGKMRSNIWNSDTLN